MLAGLAPSPMAWGECIPLCKGCKEHKTVYWRRMTSGEVCSAKLSRVSGRQIGRKRSNPSLPRRRGALRPTIRGLVLADTTHDSTHFKKAVTRFVGRRGLISFARCVGGAPCLSQSRFMPLSSPAFEERRPCSSEAPPRASSVGKHSKGPGPRSRRPPSLLQRISPGPA